jgi:hypothetical protein
MLRKTMTAGIAFFVMTGFASATDDVDWKYYGGGPIGKVATACFYESKGIVHEPAGLVRVWAKCDDRKVMDAGPPENSNADAMIDEAAKKAARYYLPPLFQIHKVENGGQVVTVTYYEVYANRSLGEPTARFLYEIDCKQLRIRERSIWIKGGIQDDRTNDWRYVDPEGNAHDLMRLVCS